MCLLLFLREVSPLFGYGLEKLGQLDVSLHFLSFGKRQLLLAHEFVTVPLHVRLVDVPVDVAHVVEALHEGQEPRVASSDGLVCLKPYERNVQFFVKEQHNLVLLKGCSTHDIHLT